MLIVLAVQEAAFGSTIQAKIALDFCNYFWNCGDLQFADLLFLLLLIPGCVSCLNFLDCLVEFDLILLGDCVVIFSGVRYGSETGVDFYLLTVDH
jgi:hypothetical protein